MKMLVIGGNGFVGSGVARAGMDQRHKVFEASRQSVDVPVDLSNPTSIVSAVRALHPDVVVNAAGIVPPGDVRQNSVFSANLLRAIHESGYTPTRIIISGSAAEYGIVNEVDLPVSENLPAHPVSDYGKSKAEETATALQLGAEFGLPVIVARIFNPIGPHMQPRFLTSRLLAQIDECRQGGRQDIEIGRRDAYRDYIDIRDLGTAVLAIATGNPQHMIYNIGSGRRLSNGELVDLFVAHSQLKPRPDIKEMQIQPEPQAASQADITRLWQDFKWSPQYSIEETVENIINDARK